MTAATSKGANPGAEHIFDMLLRDSVIDVFNGTLGKIAGQALLEAVKSSALTRTGDPLQRPDLLDQALIAHLGLVAQVLERKILKTLASKAAIAAAQLGTDRINFAAEVEKLRKQFLDRKQACNHPNTLE